MAHVCEKSQQRLILLFDCCRSRAKWLATRSQFIIFPFFLASFLFQQIAAKINFIPMCMCMFVCVLLRIKICMILEKCSIIYSIHISKCCYFMVRMKSNSIYTYKYELYYSKMCSSHGRNAHKRDALVVSYIFSNDIAVTFTLDERTMWKSINPYLHANVSQFDTKQEIPQSLSKKFNCFEYW